MKDKALAVGNWEMDEHLVKAVLVIDVSFLHFNGMIQHIPKGECIDVCLDRDYAIFRDESFPIYVEEYDLLPPCS